MKDKNNKLNITKLKLPLDFNNIEIIEEKEANEDILFIDFITLYEGFSHVGMFYKRNSNILNFKGFYENE